jgi:hypothetical protein
MHRQISGGHAMSRDRTAESGVVPDTAVPEPARAEKRLSSAMGTAERWLPGENVAAALGFRPVLHSSYFFESATSRREDPVA